MRSTFKVLFYTKNQSVKNGKAPIMGRITINGTQAGFSCKREVSLTLWDVKANCAKGKSEEARTLNQELDNIKAQITKHYQYICDHDSFVTAKKVYNRYVGFGDDYHTLMGLFREQLESYKEKIGKGKAESTYRGLVADYKSLLLFMKSMKNIEDIVIDELEKSFIEDYYTWITGTCGLANATAFGRVNTLKWLMGNRIKTGVAYVVKLLPIAIELIEKYRDADEKKDSPDCVFPVGEYNTMLLSLRIIGKKCDCHTEVTPHIGRHTFAVLAILKGMPLETLQKVLGHKSILSTQIYAELINPKVGEDTDKICEKIGHIYKLAI